MEKGLDEELRIEVEKIDKYLQKHGIEATENEILLTAIKLAKRLGAEEWGFVCELRPDDKSVKVKPKKQFEEARLKQLEDTANRMAQKRASENTDDQPDDFEVRSIC